MLSREKIYKLVEPRNKDTFASRAYNIAMLVAIAISIIPLMFREQNRLFWFFDLISGLCFIADYILRWYTADFESKRSKIAAFLLYPFTPMAIIDLLSILPSLTLVNEGFKALRMVRMLRVAMTVRVLKGLRHSRNIRNLGIVLQKSKDSLLAVGALAIGYILISALIIFNVEPETFDTFFDAVYWATISLTTVGYGDIYAVSHVGRVITMLSSFLGIAIVALPAGIFTAQYMSIIEEQKKGEKQEAEE